MKNFDVDKSYGGIFQKPISTNLKLKLLWLSCGTEDDFYSTNKAASEALEKVGIKHIWVSSEGGHEWLVWRRYLRDFTSMIFKS